MQDCGAVNPHDGLCSHPGNVTAECHPAACPKVDPVGSISDGGDVPRELRPCCPDAGDWRCHGQQAGACGCYACKRAERWRMREDLRAVAEVFKMAALKLGEKKARRRALARVFYTLSGRAQARAVELDREQALTASQGEALSRLTAELVAAQNQRDDALMQASAAAERAHNLERALEQRREKLTEAEDEADALAARLDAMTTERDAALSKLEPLYQELRDLRELGRVVAPEAVEDLARERAARDEADRRGEDES